MGLASHACQSKDDALCAELPPTYRTSFAASLMAHPDTVLHP